MSQGLDHEVFSGEMARQEGIAKFRYFVGPFSFEVHRPFLNPRWDDASDRYERGSPEGVS